MATAEVEYVQVTVPETVKIEEEKILLADQAEEVAAEPTPTVVTEEIPKEPSATEDETPAPEAETETKEVLEEPASEAETKEVAVAATVEEEVPAPEEKNISSSSRGERNP